MHFEVDWVYISGNDMDNQPMINFGPGPAKLPASVLKKIQADWLNWRGTGLSVLEIGHRSHEFLQLVEKMIDSVRKLLAIPDDFAILFLPAGAQNQFALCNMNLLGNHRCVNYVETGYWSKKAIKEAQQYTEVNICSSSVDSNYCHIPPLDSWQIDKNGAFLHFTDNETIGGLEFASTPEIEGQFLVSDMSSNLFSRPIDFHRYGCIYACAQKNFGIAGLSLVVVRKDLLDRAAPNTPSVFNYKKQWENLSLLATPPTFAFYVASLMFDWIEEQGGVTALNQLNIKKSELLYHFIDNSTLYRNPVEKPFRSRMNVPFTLTQEGLTEKFLQHAAKAGLLNLKGHRSVGGARASIYNAINLDEVQALITFMTSFENQYG